MRPLLRARPRSLTSAKAPAPTTCRRRLASEHGSCNRFSVWHVEHKRNRPAVGKVQADLAAGPQQDSALLELDFREVRGERREIGWCEARCQEATVAPIAHS